MLKEVVQHIKPLNMHVNIPQPCHENWAEMSPTQRGAFCQKCAIDVIDFSKKTPEEVKETLLNNSGKHLCGRFRKSQLHELNSDYTTWKNQGKRTFQSKFMWACLLVFGMTLFTGCDWNPANASEIMINNALQTNHIEPADSLKTIPMSTDTTETEIYPDQFEVGEIAYPLEETLLGEPMLQPEEMIQGNIITPTCEKDTVEVKEPNNPMMKGRMTPPDQFENYLKDSLRINPVTQEDTVETTNNIQYFNTHIYPNPSNGRFKLSLQTQRKGAYTVRVYDLQGKIIQEADKGMIRAGEQCIIGLNLTAFQNGYYLVEIQLNQEKQTLKIEKFER